MSRRGRRTPHQLRTTVRPRLVGARRDHPLSALLAGWSRLRQLRARRRGAQIGRRQAARPRRLRANAQPRSRAAAANVPTSASSPPSPAPLVPACVYVTPSIMDRAARRSPPSRLAAADRIVPTPTTTRAAAPGGCRVVFSVCAARAHRPRRFGLALMALGGGVAVMPRGGGVARGGVDDIQCVKRGIYRRGIFNVIGGDGIERPLATARRIILRGRLRGRLQASHAGASAA